MENRFCAKIQMNRKAKSRRCWEEESKRFCYFSWVKCFVCNVHNISIKVEMVHSSFIGIRSKHIYPLIFFRLIRTETQNLHWIFRILALVFPSSISKQQHSFAHARAGIKVCAFRNEWSVILNSITHLSMEDCVRGKLVDFCIHFFCGWLKPLTFISLFDKMNRDEWYGYHLWVTFLRLILTNMIVWI